MIKVMIVGAGGFIGSVLRYSLSGLVHRIFSRAWFPIGTLTVNVLGCFIIGFLGGLSESRQLFYSETRLFMFIGVLGGFTTFSTFGFETVNFFRDGQVIPALMNILAHIVTGIGVVYLGHFASRLL